MRAQQAVIVSLCLPLAGALGSIRCSTNACLRGKSRCGPIMGHAKRPNLGFIQLRVWCKEEGTELQTASPS